jgi:hypothetical protein
MSEAAYYRPVSLEPLDFALKKMIFSPDICTKVQGGAASMVIVPFDPQPILDHVELASAGLHLDDSPGLMRVVRQAFRTGLISRTIAPIQLGHAFELLEELPAQKLARFGTGLVRRLEIARFDDLNETQWQACGYRTKADFHKYWTISLPATPAEINPWCWLIQFDYKV